MPSPQLETRNQKLETDLRDLAQDIVRRAMNGGATAAECVIREGDEFSTLVRLGQVETLKESGSKAIGVRVFNGKRAASTYSSDFSHKRLDRSLHSAQNPCQLARLCWRISTLLLFSGCCADRSIGNWRYAARLLVFRSPFLEPAGIARARWQSCGRAHFAALGRKES